MKEFFDFCVLTVHTSPDLATEEIYALKTAISEVSSFYAEPDVICLGDFNANGIYYAEGEDLVLSGFDNYITGIPNSADTTVAASSNTYDRIQMTSSMESDYTNTWGLYLFSDYYDVSICEGSKTTAGTVKALSDHYPVWTE